MSYKEFFRINKTFSRFMISYVIILSFTVLIGMVTYSKTIKMVKEDSIKEGLILLEKGRDILDTRFTEVGNLITQVSFQNEIKNMYNIENPLQYTEYCRLIEAHSQISSFLLTNTFIDEFYIVLKNSDVLVSSRYISDRLPSFYEMFIKYEDMDYSEWYDNVVSTYHYKSIWPSHSIIDNNNKYSRITYLQSIPLSNYSSYKGVALALINEKKIHEYLTTLDTEQGGWLYIVNNEGQIISSVNPNNIDISSMGLNFSESKSFVEKTIGGINYTIMHIASSQLEWTYVVALPSSVFEQKAAYVRSLFGYTSAIILFIGLLVAVYLSYRNSQPIRKLIKHLRDGIQGETIQNAVDYDFIEGSVSRLINNNKELKEELDSQVPYIRAGFYERLLRGNFNHLKEINTALSYARMDMYGEGYIVALMKIDGFNTVSKVESVSVSETAHLLAEKVLKQYLWEKCYMHSIDEKKVAIIIILDMELEKSSEVIIEQKLEEIIDQLYIEYNISISFGIGGKYTNLMEISHSLREAERALEYKNWESTKRVVQFKNVMKKNTGYYYPVDLEMRLINLTRSGEQNEAIQIIKNVYVKNCVRNQLSTRETNLLLYEIRGTIEKINGELAIEDPLILSVVDDLIAEIEYCDSTESIFDLVIKIYICFCSHINEKKRMHEECLVQRILDYINTHYLDETMCLYHVSSEFKLTEKYLSQFFKENTGENFSSYVEKLRIQQAVKLLGQRDLSVTDIAKRIGYTNDNTFYKAFKRMYGISPSIYRSTH